jgi:hypothetical protein
MRSNRQRIDAINSSMKLLCTVHFPQQHPIYVAMVARDDVDSVGYVRGVEEGVARQGGHVALGKPRARRNEHVTPMSSSSDSGLTVVASGSTESEFFEGPPSLWTVPATGGISSRATQEAVRAALKCIASVNQQTWFVGPLF